MVSRRTIVGTVSAYNIISVNWCYCPVLFLPVEEYHHRPDRHHLGAEQMP